MKLLRETSMLSNVVVFFFFPCRCPPRTFLPALCKIFLDESAPDNVLEVTARAITYYLDVSAECTRRIVGVDGAIKALCNRLVVVELNNRTSRDLAEQCVKVRMLKNLLFLRRWKISCFLRAFLHSNPILLKCEAKTWSVLKAYVPVMLLIFTVHLGLFRAEIPLKKSIEEETKKVRRKFFYLVLHD